jgi:hypothetical protein
LVRNDIGKGGLAALGHGYFQRRYAILFYSLLLTMVIAPALGALGLEAGLLEFIPSCQSPRRGHPDRHKKNPANSLGCLGDPMGDKTGDDLA